jgi:hypothetical protein
MTQFNNSESNKASALNAGNTLDANKFDQQLLAQVEQFNTDLEFKAETWNAQNAQAVEQSNLTWRRSANTAETAAQNAANQAGAQFAFNMTSAEQTYLWQKARDEAAFAQQTLETTKERAMGVLSSIYSNGELMKKGIDKAGVRGVVTRLDALVGL